MAIRILSGVIGVPLLIGLVLYGQLPFKVAALFFAVFGMKEFYHALHKKTKKIDYVGYLFAILYFLTVIPTNGELLLLHISLFMISLLICLILWHTQYNITDATITFFGFFYVCFLFSHIVLVRNQPSGLIFVWLIFISAWGSDTGAYFTGVTLGRHKLCPLLSPNKTIEGSVGGIILAGILSYVYGAIMMEMYPIPIQNFGLLCTFIGAIGAVLAQLGDLAASAIKRFVNIKDYGSLIPGHGGVLDRFDSILFTAPLVYYIVMYFAI